MFRAKVVDVSNEAVTIEATGAHDKLEALLRVLEPFGVERTGQVRARGRRPRVTLHQRAQPSLGRAPGLTALTAQTELTH